MVEGRQRWTLCATEDLQGSIYSMQPLGCHTPQASDATFRSRRGSSLSGTRRTPNMPITECGSHAEIMSGLYRVRHCSDEKRL